MNIAILGGNGYLGNKLGERLAQKHTVYSVTRGNVDSAWAKEKWSYAELDNKLQTIKIDWLINCICRYEKAGILPEEILEANYLRPYSCVVLGSMAGIKNYITIDTGLPKDLNLYCISKAQFADSAEWKLKDVFGEQGYAFWNVKLENFYGEDEPAERFIPGTVDRLGRNEQILITEGYQKRDFIYIEDVINNLEKLLVRKETGRINLPLGSGRANSIRKIILYLKEIANSDSEICFGAIPTRKNEPDSVADYKIMERYDIEIQYPWQMGFEQMVYKRLRIGEKEQ